MHLCYLIIYIFAAICKQACENGGKCLSPGICFCPSGYYGHNCQNGKFNLENVVLYAIHVFNAETY